MKRIGIMTGTRAEYGLLKPLMRAIDKDRELELYLIVSGMHLSPEFGLTYKEIEEDGFGINAKVEMLLSSDSPVGISKSIGLGIIGFADEFKRAGLDMLILLGDRYEALAAAVAAMIMRIPISHLHGGELTEGLIDEGIRHSITKMSYLHFTSTEEYRRRVIQLGENPERVFCVGAIGVENIKKTELMSKEELENSIHFEIDDNVAVVTYHPVTLENNTVENQFTNLLRALDRNDKLRIIFTKANADTNGRIINELIDKFVTCNRERACAFYSLGQKRYLSALKYCRLVIGNSSSGIIEAPSFGKPVIVLGDLNQLPPVFGKPFFLQEPDYILTEIMRQNEGNPIIWLSQRILNKEKMIPGVYGNSAIIEKSDLTDYTLKHASIILTGTNKLRYMINVKFREEIFAYKNLDIPHYGEKIICRKNNWNRCIGNGYYLTNGMTGFVDYVDRESYNKKSISIDFRPDFLKSSYKNVKIDYDHLYSSPTTEMDLDEESFYDFTLDKFEWANAITVHSSQGSQWDNVLYLDERMGGNEDFHKKLMYTAITRAVNSITFCI